MGKSYEVESNRASLLVFDAHILCFLMIGSDRTAALDLPGVKV